MSEEPGYEERDLQLEHAVLLLAYSDGLIEARRDGELYGVDRLTALVAARVIVKVRALRIERRVEDIPLDVDELQRFPGLFERVGRDGNDGRTVVAGFSLEPFCLAWAEHRMDARRFESALEIDAVHAGVRMRIAEDGRVEHSRELEVGGVARLAADALGSIDAHGFLSHDGPWAGWPLLERIFLDDEPDVLVPPLDFLLGLDQSRHVARASSIFGYVPQRQRFPAIACRISSRLGLGCFATSTAAETTWPGVQKPHCTASARTNASTSGWSRSPSIVVISAPSSVCTSVMHDSIGTPPTSTVQAPQCPSPHATFVPVRPRSSRSTSASDRPTGTSTWYAWPLTFTSSTGRHRNDVR